MRLQNGERVGREVIDSSYLTSYEDTEFCRHGRMEVYSN